MDTYFERKAYRAMLEWKDSYAPGYALFLKGARRVGKTTLAEKLGREQYRSYILVRFDQAEQAVKDLFTDSLRDLDSLFQTLQFAYGTRLYERESLVICSFPWPTVTARISKTSCTRPSCWTSCTSTRA